MRLEGKQILVCITGGIAAYKGAELVRRLNDAGACVRVAMTERACAFITPLSLQALSGFPVHTHLFDEQAEQAMGHIELARWAQLILIAPASANCIARLAHGLADDLITTVCLATQAQLAVAPAMNQHMYANVATQENLNHLKARGHLIWGPAHGQQACGDVGYGRLLEPDELVEQCCQFFTPKTLSNVRVTITAGPTYEAIDPVRFIGNHSSGKMGFALAQAATECGALVTLISGPTNLNTPTHTIRRIDCVSAREMHEAALQAAANCDIFIGCAAVSDYRPDKSNLMKIKKSADTLTLRLVANPDIISDVAKQKHPPFLVGFAAETEHVTTYATEKLHRKGLDLIIANDVSQKDCGFHSDDNAAILIGANETIHFDKMPKVQLAHQLIHAITERYQAHEKSNRS